jgi:ABC-2 type transport system permease protein
VKQDDDGEPCGASADVLPRDGTAAAVAGFVSKTAALVKVEMLKLRHDSTEMVTRAFQPVLWLVVFGEVFSRFHAIPSGNLSYRAFLAPGVLAQSVLFVSIFYGIAIIWEKDLGIVQKLLVTPTPRAALVLGKGVAAGLRGLSQAAIIYLLAIVLRVPLNWSPGALLGVALFVMLGAALFSTFSLAIACVVKTRERFMGIGQILTMPLFLMSNAIYPISIMPPWMRAAARFNPLSYEIDALRALMPSGGVSSFGLWTDFGVLSTVSFVLVLLGARLYPRVVI